MSRFKKCPNGHTYRSELSECPICNSGRNAGIPQSNSQATQIIDSLDGESFGLQTTTDDEPILATRLDVNPHMDFSKTQIDTGEEEIENDSGTKKELRNDRKLVGWLVTWSHDENGQDFKLFEGRNIIGRDINCDISINDPKVSSQHAILLYRNGKFRIKDSLSANGTIVQGEDIDDDSFELKDGYSIKVGDTEFVFRTALPEK